MKRTSIAFAMQAAKTSPNTNSVTRIGRFLPLFAALFVLYLLVPTTQLHATACWAAWNSSTAYVGGSQVSYNGENYQADYWTQDNIPSSNSGAVGTGEPWIPEGSCSGSGGGGATPTPTSSGGGGCSSTSITPYIQVNGGSWAEESSATVSAGASVNLGPQPVTGGSWSWTGPNGYSSTSRQIGITVNSTSTYTATYTNSSGCQSSQSFTLTVSGSGGGGGCSPTSITPYIQVNGGSWAEESSATVSAGASVNLGPQPVTGGSWSWSGPNGYSSTSRQIGITVNSTSTYTATYTNSSGCNSSQSFTLTVSGGGSSGGSGGGGKMFAPYIDLSLSTDENPASIASSAGLHSITLAFLVDGGCVGEWGGLGGSVSGATFPDGTSVASQINQLTSNGVQVIISWGGADGSVASSCTNASSIQSMYQSVFNAYPNIAGQDFDIEGGIPTTAFAQALAGLKAANPSKQISLTLPVLPTGLVSAGLSIVQACQSAGFNPDLVNVMAMDYGSGQDGLSSGATMGGDAEEAGSSTHGQTGTNIGITPMIGVNDTSTEVFQLSDASNLVSWANGQGYVTRLAFWSLGRDNDGCPGQDYASATCSGVSQSSYQFSSIFNGY